MKHLCWSLCFNKVAGLQVRILLRKIPAQMFSYKFWKNFKKNYIAESLEASAYSTIIQNDIKKFYIQKFLFRNNKYFNVFSFEYPILCMKQKL